MAAQVLETTPNFNVLRTTVDRNCAKLYVYPPNFDFAPPNLKILTEFLITKYSEPVSLISPTEICRLTPRK